VVLSKKMWFCQRSCVSFKENVDLFQKDVFLSKLLWFYQRKCVSIKEDVLLSKKLCFFQRSCASFRLVWKKIPFFHKETNSGSLQRNFTNLCIYPRNCGSIEVKMCFDDSNSEKQFMGSFFSTICVFNKESCNNHSAVLPLCTI